MFNNRYSSNRLCLHRIASNRCSLGRALDLRHNSNNNSSKYRCRTHRWDRKWDSNHKCNSQECRLQFNNNNYKEARLRICTSNLRLDRYLSNSKFHQVRPSSTNRLWNDLRLQSHKSNSPHHLNPSNLSITMNRWISTMLFQLLMTLKTNMLTIRISFVPNMKSLLSKFLRKKRRLLRDIADTLMMWLISSNKKWVYSMRLTSLGLT